MKWIFFLCTFFYLLAIGRLNSADLEELSLSRAEVLALENNYTIQSAYHISEEGYYNYLVTVGRWLPQIEADASVFKQPNGPGAGYGTYTTSTIAFLQVLFDPDVYFNIKASKIDMYTLREELIQEMCDILFDTRIAYYQIIAAEDLVQTEKANVELLREQYELYKARFELGEGIKFDVSSSEAAVLDALSFLYAAQNAFEISQNTFLALMSFPPTYNVTLADDNIDIEDMPALKGRVDFSELKLVYKDLLDMPTVNRLEQIALRYKPEIEIRRLNLSLSRTNYHHAIARYIPSVSLFSTVHNNGLRSSPPKSFTRFGINASWTLFDGFSRENNIRGTREVVYSSVNNLEQSILDAQKDIYNLISTMKSAVQTYLASKKAVHVASEAVDIAQERALAGDITPLDYRNSVFLLREARQDLIRSEFDVMAAYFGLVRAIGLDVDHLKRPCFDNYGFSCFDF